MTNPLNFRSQIQSRLPEIQGKKILIFGDVGIDEYIFGDVYRISPEAPVPVVDVSSRSKKMGLSANVAANVKSLGGTPLLVSVVGDDREGETLQALLSEQGIPVEGLLKDNHRPTTAKTRILSGQHHIVRVDSENRSPVSEATYKGLKEQVQRWVEDCDGVILQDYAKGLVTEVTSQMVIQEAKAAGKPVLVDPYRSTDLSFYNGADLMTPNRDEALELGMQIPELKNKKDIDQLGRALMAHIGSPQMVITLGAEGMKIFNQEDAVAIPTFARKVFDVTGAGDTVISAFALGLATGWNLEMSGYLANLAAGIVVGHVGAVACSTEALVEALKNQ